MYILGINAYHGDAAAALIKDGRIVAAVEEERFNRIKHCAGFPTESVKYCLRTAGIEIDAVDHVGISRDPSAHLHKKFWFAAAAVVGATRAAKGIRGRRSEVRGQWVQVIEEDLYPSQEATATATAAGFSARLRIVCGMPRGFVI